MTTRCKETESGSVECQIGKKANLDDFAANVSRFVHPVDHELSQSPESSALYVKVEASEWMV